MKNITESILKIGIIRFKGERRRIFELKKTVSAKTKILMSYIDIFTLYSAASKMAAKEGDFAEVGVYKGGSALILANILKNSGKKLFLFDRFDYITVEKVKSFFGEYGENVQIIPGTFPETADVIRDRKFAFVHLDVNLYEPTYASLEFFYPRLVKGGIILGHDYFGHGPENEGVKRAFDEFFADKDETVLETTGSYCMVVKLE